MRRCTLIGSDHKARHDAFIKSVQMRGHVINTFLAKSRSYSSGLGLAEVQYFFTRRPSLEYFFLWIWPPPSRVFILSKEEKNVCEGTSKWIDAHDARTRTAV